MAILGDYIRIKHGFAFKGDYITTEDNGVVLVTPGNFEIGGGFKEKKCKFFFAEYPVDYVLHAGDLIVTMTDLSKQGDTLGFSALVPNSNRTYLHNQRIGLVDVFNPEADKDYIYWFMRTPYYQKTIVATASGSTVKHTSPLRICDVKIELPPLDEQKKISSILRSIDDKIENNQKIKDNLLKQLTVIYKSLYRDFSLVNDANCVDSEYGKVPYGWKYTLLADLCQSVSVKHKFNKEKLIFLNTGDIEDGRFLHSNYMTVKDMPGQAKKTIEPGDILYSEIRPINRHFAYVNIPSDDHVVSTKLMVIRAKDIDSRRLYHYLTLDDTLIELQQQAESRSGTFPQIRFENLSKLPILIADEQTESKFTDILHSVYDQIDNLNIENEKLAELRDSLLPKLISGEIDVSKIQKTNW